MGNLKSIAMAAAGVALGVAVGMLIYDRMFKNIGKTASAGTTSGAVTEG